MRLYTLTQADDKEAVKWFPDQLFAVLAVRRLSPERGRDAVIRLVEFDTSKTGMAINLNAQFSNVKVVTTWGINETGTLEELETEGDLA